MQYVTVVLVLVLIFMFYKMKKQISQVNHLNDILYIKKMPHMYVTEMDKILAGKQTEKNKVINTIQKTTGMLYAGRFEELIDILEHLDDVPKNWMPIYYQNLVLALYFSKDKNKANEELKKAKTVFEEFRNNQYYRELIDIVYVVSDFYNGKNTKKNYAQLAETGANDYRKSFGYYFLGMINKKENNSEEANENLKKAMECGRGSFVERLSIE